MAGSPSLQSCCLADIQSVLKLMQEDDELGHLALKRSALRELHALLERYCKATRVTRRLSMWDLEA